MSADFSVKLSALRKEKGISQRKAAQELRISQALLSHYEKGIRECSLDFVKKAALYYGVSADYLLGLSEEKQPSAEWDLPALTDRANGDGGLPTVGGVMNALLYTAKTAAEAGADAQAFFCGFYCLAQKCYAAAADGGFADVSALAAVAVRKLLEGAPRERLFAQTPADPPPPYAAAADAADRMLADALAHLTNEALRAPRQPARF